MTHRMPTTDGPALPARLLSLLLLFSMVLSLLPAAAVEMSRGAYVEPSLQTGTTEALSVIVTGRDLQSALAAVRRAGGEVTTELWLINAVAATVPASSIESLAGMPGIRSVVANKRVESSTTDGYVTKRRTKAQSVRIPLAATTAAMLPNGGFVTVDGDGNAYFFNEAGSQVGSKLLSGTEFDDQIAVTPDSHAFISGRSNFVYAFDAVGTQLWSASAGSGIKFEGPLTTDGGIMLYATTDANQLIAFNRNTGARLWTRSLGGGQIASAPLLGPTLTRVFVASHDGSATTITAMHLSGRARWTYSTPQNEELLFDPLVTADEIVYIVTDQKNLYALDGMTGALRFSYTHSKDIITRPSVSADGTVFFGDNDKRMVAVEQDGSVRYIYTQVSAQTIVGVDYMAEQDVVVVTDQDGGIEGVDAVGGTMLWQQNMLMPVDYAPRLDRHGALLVGGRSGDIWALDGDGTLLSVHDGSGEVTAMFSSPFSDHVFVTSYDSTDGEHRAYAIGRLADEHDGRPDVADADGRWKWRVASPVTVDIGADDVHIQLDAMGNEIIGEGVTIAMVDSGVFFDDDVRQTLGNQVQQLFYGQIDFVASECPVVGNGKNAEMVGQQYPEYCLLPPYYSNDGYGHGTAVSGAIWNNYIDEYTDAHMGVAPGASILSVRVLDDSGQGTYEDVVRGIQEVVSRKDDFNIRIMNLSLSAPATTPYFVDPVNRAVEEAWAAGIVVVAAAGNSGSGAETITVPGNDPYVITVGSVDSNRTPGYWADDLLAHWSSTGPTLDGFVKPDILAPGANIVTFMHNNPENFSLSQYLVQQHPDYSLNSSLFRMNGTSLSTGIASGAVALMLQQDPTLTPDEVKYRLMASARTATSESGEAIYNVFQQGAGRLWVPDAVFGDFPAGAAANQGMDIQSDLAHGWESGAELAFHYQGPMSRMTSDDGTTLLYVGESNENERVGLGAADATTSAWLTSETLEGSGLSWAGKYTYDNGLVWAGGFSWSGAGFSWSGVGLSWSGVGLSWSGVGFSWSGVGLSWSGVGLSWSGVGLSWSGVNWEETPINPQAASIAPTTWAEGQ